MTNHKAKCRLFILSFSLTFFLIFLSACPDDAVNTTSPSEESGQETSEATDPLSGETPFEPSIRLTFPLEGTRIAEGTEIRISATASDSDGTIVRVDFYDNGRLLGSDASAPYTFNWSDAVLGSHDLHAVAIDDDDLSAVSATHRLTVTQGTAGTLVTYPVTEAIDGRFKSSRFAVHLTQNGSTAQSFVYESANDADPSWSGTLNYMQTANHWTTFSFNGNVDVEAYRLDGQNIETCVVRPLSLNIEPEIQGDKCTFTLSEPAKVSVEIDENNTVTGNIENIGTITKHIVKHPLFVFADPLEVDPPAASDAHVIYFEPGLHNIGKGYQIPNDTQVYLAGGAYVIGTLTSEEPHPSNITIRGRGILSGFGLSESSSENLTWGNHAIDLSNGSNGSGLLIEGITITDPLRSCIVSYNTVDIRNVKLFSWEHRNDGIVAGDNSLIENNFIKVQDDNIKLYYSNQTVSDNVIWQQTSGAVFKFAWDLKRVAQNNLVTGIDVIHSDVFTDYTAAEPDRPDMHSTSAVFSAMGFQDGAAFQNNAFEDIRIEEENLLRLMSLRLVSTHASPSETSVWGDPDPTASKLIYNLTFDNIELAGVPYKQSTLYGNSGGTIKKIWFSNLKIKDNVIGSKAEFSSRLDGVGLLTDGDVLNIIIAE